MYINNAKLSLSPKWLYIIVPTLFFAFAGLNFLVSLLFDISFLIKAEIASKGELAYLTENLLTFAIFLVVSLLWVKYVHREPLTVLTTARPKIDWKRFWFAFALWEVVTVGVTLIDYVIHPEAYAWNLQWMPFLKLLVIVVLMMPLQTGFEEVFSRAYLMQAVGLTVRNAWLPLLVTSVTSGLMHLANPEVEKLGYMLLIHYIGTGFSLGIITLMDDGTELALGFHTANNLFTALLVTSDWTVFQVPPLLRDVSELTLGLTLWVPLLIRFPLMLYIYAKKYHWKDIKKHLITR